MREPILERNLTVVRSVGNHSRRKEIGILIGLQCTAGVRNCLNSDLFCLYEPRREKTVFFCIGENKDADQLRGKAKLISVFVFAT